MMKNAIAAIACAALLALNSTGADAARKPGADAAAFIDSIGRQVLETLDDKSLTQEERTKRFYTLFRKSFHGDRISAFSLGKYKRTIDSGQFEEYRDLFGKYMTGLYAAKFANYSGETFVVTGSHKPSDTDTDVSAEIQRKQGTPPIRLMFRISDADEELKIYDVVIEGVSLLAAKRQEVTSVIARDGMDQLIERLKEAVQLAELN